MTPSPGHRQSPSRRRIAPQATHLALRTSGPRQSRLWVAMLAVLLLSACGWAEVGPRGPYASNSPTRAATSNDRVFANASAVIVGRGDSVYALSKRHKVSQRAIIDANNLKAPYHLKIGQRIVLPRATVHVVKRGETLYGVSRKYGVSVYKLARSNNLKAPYHLEPGRKLNISGAGRASVQRASTSSRSKSGRSSRRTARSKTPKPKALPVPPPPKGKGFIWPVKGRVILGYGPKDKGLHNDGVNIAAKRGSSVVASQSGVIAYAGNEIKGFGNLLLVKHAGGWISAYAHNDKLLVKRGQKVIKGQAIAKVGSSGSVVRPQLHFELRKGKRAVDPARYLRAGNV